MLPAVVVQTDEKENFAILYCGHTCSEIDALGPPITGCVHVLDDSVKSRSICFFGTFVHMPLCLSMI